MLHFWDTALELFPRTKNLFARMTSRGSSGGGGGGCLKTESLGEAARWKWLEGEDLERGKDCQTHMVDQDRKVDHSRPPLLLLCMHSHTHVHTHL